MRVKGAIPWLVADLVELVESGVVHEDEDDAVGDTVGTEPAERVIAGIDPAFAQGAIPKGKTNQHGRECAEEGKKRRLTRKALHDWNGSLERVVGKDSLFGEIGGCHKDIFRTKTERCNNF